MVRHVQLHGGPLHGRQLTIPDDMKCVTIEAPPQTLFTTPDHPDNEPIPSREGHYSAVAGRPGDFEWDGWRPHQNE
ncbi:hypothetical protein SEA_GARDENB_49 [Microbacterium phage GardenB]|nr:hypothetical protein SEA_GARDENB_49 [Microbacterium phage GardenB]